MYQTDIQIINELLQLEGQVFDSPVKYQKTAKLFKIKHGIELYKAPKIFVKGMMLYKLCFTSYTYRGRVYEKAQYLPFVSVGQQFKRLEKNITV